MARLEEFIEGLILKDEESFEQIYNETKHSVYALIVSIVKNKADAEDIMQDTYIKMIASIHMYQPKYPFKNWILTIAKNLAIDFLRKKQFTTIIGLEDFEYIVPSKDISPQLALEINEQLNKMTDIERQIFLLHVVDDLKHKEIAAILNKPLGTILWHYQKALKKVK
ncbi:MAG TPA: RNA polymerase sigma factor [Bacilli bacterium]|nr:RNA polymerase sigma factor [Bacilli bacterium]